MKLTTPRAARKRTIDIAAVVMPDFAIEALLAA
jgi:hypothetical protein